MSKFLKYSCPQQMCVGLTHESRKSMNANPIRLQKKYARVVSLFAKQNKVILEKALDIFYHSVLYELMSEGVFDMYCMGDEYLMQELEEEQKL